MHIAINPALGGVADFWDDDGQPHLTIQPAWEVLAVTDATGWAIRRQPLNSKGALPDPRAAKLMTWDDIRLARGVLLTACDYRVMPDYPASADSRTAWTHYRQALRDVTKQADPNALVWPTTPAANL